MTRMKAIVVMDKKLDEELKRIHAHFPDAGLIGSYADFLRYLNSLPEVPSADRVQRSLDLIDHRFHGDALMAFGSWKINANEDNPSAELEKLAKDKELPRLGITEVRLLGCATACSPAALATIKYMTQILKVPVVATRWAIGADDFKRDGVESRSLPELIDSRELQRRGWKLPDDCLNALAIATSAKKVPQRVA